MVMTVLSSYFLTGFIFLRELRELRVLRVLRGEKSLKLSNIETR